MTHDFKSEKDRRDRTKIARLDLNIYVVHGDIRDLEACIGRLQNELEYVKEEARLEAVYAEEPSM